MKPAWLVAAGLAVVVTVGLVVAFAGGDQTSDHTLAYGRVTVDGPALPVAADPNRDIAVGLKAPTLVGVTPGGQPITIQPGGRPVVVIFLAHWCPHCQAEVPRLQDWIDQTGGPTGVDLYAVATGTDPNRPNFPPGSWLEREGFTPPVLLDDESDTAGMAYGVTSFPYWVVLDPEGRVVVRLAGELGRDGIEALFQAAARLNGA